MADGIDIISDEDLQAPLDLAKNYRKLADDFDAVAASTTLLISKIESQDANIKELTGQTQALEKEVKRLEAANKKAAKSTESMAAATELADNATGGLLSRTKALGKQFIALLANPIVALFAGLAVVLGSVATYFKSTNDGADKFERIMAAMNGVVAFLTNKFAKLGEQIVKLFEEGNVVGQLFIGVLNFVVNRIAGVIDAFTNLLQVINILAKYNLKDLLTGNLSEEDIKALNKAFVDLGKNAVKAITGVGDALDEVGAQLKAIDAITQAQQKLGDDLRDRILSKAQAELEIEKLLFAAKDKSNNTDQQRLDSLRKAVQISQDQLKIDLDLAVRKERAYAAQLAQDAGIANSNKLLKEGTTLLQDQLIEAKASDAQLEERKKLQADVINLQRNFFAENKKSIAQIGALQKEIDDEAIARAEKLVKARVKAFDAYIQGTKEVSALEILGVQQTNNDKEKLYKDFGQRLIDDSKARAKKQEEIEKENLEKLKEIEEEKRLVRETALVAVEMVGNEIFSRRQEKLAEESKMIEEQREKDLAAAGDDERKKLAINRKADRDQAKIKTKQAQADKQAAIFGIIINTALGIVKASPVVPLMIATGILGAIQLALVASKPIPKFALGTDHSPSTFIAGEKGRELVQHGGSTKLVDGPTLFTGMTGSKVFSNKDTEEILGTSADIGHAIRYGSKVKQSAKHNDRVVEVLAENNKWLKKIANKPEMGMYVDEEGFHSYSNAVARRNARINRRFLGK